jgi:hypothetical protein
LVKSRQLHALLGLHGDSGGLTEDHTGSMDKTIGRPPAIRPARCAWRRRRISYHHPAGIFVPTGLRSLSDRACRKRNPAWNGHRNACDRISRCLQRPELLRIEGSKDVIAFFASLNYEVLRGSTVSP